MRGERVRPCSRIATAFGVRVAAGAAIVVIMSAVGTSCAQTDELAEGRSSTTLRIGEDDLALGDDLAGSSAAAGQMQDLVDELLASNNACAILNQQAAGAIKLDPTTMMSSSARRVLAKGIVDIYDHLVTLVDDPAVKPALLVQQATFVEVLDIVDRYADSPSSKRGADEIKALAGAPQFVAASQSVATWVTTNC